MAAWTVMEQRSPVGLYQTDATGACVYVNSRWCELTGLDAEQAIGAGWAQALHPDDRERVFAAWTQAAETANPFADEYRFLHPDGTVVWVYGQATPEVGDDGAAAAFIGSVTDITERKLAEEALRESQAHLQLATDAAHVGTWQWTIATGDIRWSAPHQRMWGYEPSAAPLAYDDWARLVHPDDLPHAEWAIAQCLQCAAEYDVEYRITPLDGEKERWIRSVGRANHDRDGRAFSMLGVSFDITEQKQAALDLTFLAELSERIQSSMDADALLAEVLCATGEYFQATRCVFSESDAAKDCW
ncbi:MAG: PAS domain-containing protein, partial [Thermomicrobiales bacterium]